MDTSETYIKMSDCPEIQKLRATRTYHFPEEPKIVKEYPREKTDSYAGLIWLPHQDQLQGMLEGTVHDKLGRLYRAIEKMIMYPHETMEQLWLAFVMKEKYNKVWNGEQWGIQQLEDAALSRNMPQVKKD